MELLVSNGPQDERSEVVKVKGHLTELEPGGDAEAEED